jgi:hypothetical protein
MKTEKLVYPAAFLSIFSVTVGAILMVGGNPIGEYMIVFGAILGTLITHKLD